MITRIPKRWLTLCFVSYLFTMLVAGLWPFSFRPKNDVQRTDHDGLIFGKRGMAYARDLDWHDPSEHGFTVEAWLRADEPVTDHLANIICITQGRHCSAFLVAQWQSSIIVEASYRDTHGPVSLRHLGVNGSFIGKQWHHFVIATGPDGTQIFIDGTLRERSSRFVLLNSEAKTLVVGNDPEGEEPWRGSMRALAIYERELAPDEVGRRFAAWRLTGTVPRPAQDALWFDFTGTKPAASLAEQPRIGTVYIPVRFIPVRRSLLRWDAKINRSGITDIAVNLFGFVPFGFLAAQLIARRNSSLNAIIWSSLLGFAISAGIEITQAFMPGRDSSSVDLLFNFLGTILGACLLMALSDRPAADDLTA